MTAGALFSIVLAGTAPVGPPLAFAPRAEVSASRVTLGEVADLSVLPARLRGPAAQVVIATFRPGQLSLTLKISEVAERARAQAPALAPWFGADTVPTITLRRLVEAPSPAPRAKAQTCLRLLAPLGRGDVPMAADFEPSPCEATTAAFRYDPASGVARAARGLGAGDIVTAPPTSILAAARPGQVLRLRAHVGPVVVERAVEVVRPSVQGRALFVKGSDGKAFAAPMPEPVS